MAEFFAPASTNFFRPRHKLLALCIIGPNHVEQLLNIVWLVVVAGIVVAVTTQPQRSWRAHPPHVAIVVFACVAVLLFPVISATDDLHPGSDLSDDAAWRHGKRGFGVQVLALILLISIAPLLLWRSNLWRPFALRLGATSPGHLRLNFGRAPPVIF